MNGNGVISLDLCSHSADGSCVKQVRYLENGFTVELNLDGGLCQKKRTKSI